MATPSSILAWRIPGTEEPSGLLSMGSHRVGHNWSDLAAAREIYIYKGNLHLWGCLPFCGFLGGSVVKNGPANAEDMGLMLGSERSPAEGNGNLLQYFCLENPMDRGAWRATVHGIAKSQTWLRDWTELTLNDTMDCSLPGSFVHGISQARVLECIAISSSRGSSQPKDPTLVSCIDRQVLYHWATWEVLIKCCCC